MAREILTAANSGFCFGVKQAIEKTEEEIRRKAESSESTELQNHRCNLSFCQKNTAAGGESPQERQAGRNRG